MSSPPPSWFAFLHVDPDEDDVWITTEMLLLVPLVMGLAVLLPSLFCSEALRKPKTD